MSAAALTRAAAKLRAARRRREELAAAGGEVALADQAVEAAMALLVTTAMLAEAPPTARQTVPLFAELPVTIDLVPDADGVALLAQSDRLHVPLVVGAADLYMLRTVAQFAARAAIGFADQVDGYSTDLARLELRERASRCAAAEVPEPVDYADLPAHHPELARTVRALEVAAVRYALEVAEDLERLEVIMRVAKLAREHLAAAPSADAIAAAHPADVVAQARELLASHSTLVTALREIVTVTREVLL